MTYRTFYVSHSKNGFKLYFVERSIVRDLVMGAADKLCVLTGHRWCNRLAGVPVEWAEKKEKVLLEMPTDRETIRPVQYHEDDWSYVDEDAD